MATRRSRWVDRSGADCPVSFDHGAQCFAAVRPRFQAVMARAVAAGHALRWQPLIHAARSREIERCYVAQPSTPALCGHLLAGTSLRLNSTVRRLLRNADGAWFVATDDAPLAGPFDHVVVALPPAQAAVLLAGHQDAWAASTAARRMDPCMTLMAVTDDVDWPWDAAEPDRGPLAWVVRNDRLPGRAAKAGYALWTAHATAEWSAEHLEASPEDVKDALQAALRALLPSTGYANEPVRWHHAETHRWRYAGPSLECEDAFDGGEAWWDASLGLGVCGDWLCGGGVEAAWHSGDELADVMAASIERAESAAEPEWALS